ncbi:hypothetical protein BCF11_0232 [Collimonas sp. PA-H2]|uniref:hypothetical protein n=1 Tax=Collimonas sp. PA-H2 TaxID=1881062 RepID=UPI000BF5A36C|nr:hypothetical protein [Collimonas sp. PA-H2]PFH07884.1 hypothetical protein BCF11_0232 [Collimonas sp. PA-H2]
MMESERKFLSLESRLAAYNLRDRIDRLPDLRVEPNETVVLTADEEELHPHLVRLRPDSAHDLKRWLGVPDHAARSTLSPSTENIGIGAAASVPGQIFIPRPPIDRIDPEMQTNLYNFLFNNTRGVSDESLQVFKKYIDRVQMLVSLFLFHDIYVSRHSRLVIDRKVQVLFARYITVEHTGILEMQAPYARIDCAGIRTASAFNIGENLTAAVTISSGATSKVKSLKN